MGQDVVSVHPPPPTVRVAIALQFALVATLTSMAAVAVAEAVHYDSLIDQAARVVGASPADVAVERSGNVSAALFTTVAALLLATWLGVTAWRMRRRSNIARILALVGLGAPLALGVLACLAGGLIGVVLAGALLSSPAGVEPEEADSTAWGGEALFEEIDRLSGTGWSLAFDAAGSITLLLGLLLTVATGVLLLVRGSSHYFRPEPPIAVHTHPGYAPGPFVPYPYPATPFGNALPPRPHDPGKPGSSSSQ
ncbi:hypothetical protein [Actinoplanes utahensis]|uniref:Uncharacterized protein n=1 Tax=Actinoplanes utahensis TaxID=1869 RepID=A0A0A6URY6_ACTUT|nr:hypothetical protein [Actinoplanes utahensis]KHD77224.1 hypothetical protein MB27_12345 [Actinoplanes utahensis]GIF33554.1 hypothetical protein Aut01nite_65400 [Actinoplanes utahensis]